MKNWKNINNKIGIFKIVTMVTMFLLLAKLALVGVYNNSEFSELAKYQTTIETASELPRGEIYDTNNKLLVGSINNKALYYIESDIMTMVQKMELSQRISQIIEIENQELNQIELADLILSEKEYKKQIESSLTKEENVAALKMKDDEYGNFLRTKVSDEIKNDYITKYGHEAVYIRTKILGATNKTPVEIKKILTIDETYALESAFGTIGGFYVTDDWVRTYPYGETMRSFLGKSGPIPAEQEGLYESKGYKSNEDVGISYLEKELESVLHSKAEEVEFNFDGNGNIVNTKIVKPGVAGSDVVLTIDIDIQQKVDEEIKKYLAGNSYVFNTSAYATIQDPNTGNIIAMSGINELNGEYYDNAIGNFTESYIMGSILKAAILLTAYENGTRNWGDVIVDEQMIMPGTPIKSSYKNFGAINEMQAIAWSSNVYFYKTILNLAGQQYVKDGYLNIESKYFDLVRKSFQQFGLGTSTGINMQNESVGFTGSGINPGFYMDLANGQYDTYTTLQTSQYVNTIANGGTRYKTEYIKSINKPNEANNVGPVQEEKKSTVLNKLTMKQEDIIHVQDAMRGCDTLAGPAACKGMGFEKTGTSMAGKSGTAESFYYDEKSETVYNTFGSSMIGFFPEVDPDYSISVHIPNFTNNQNTASVTNAMNLGANIMARVYGK